MWYWLLSLAFAAGLFFDARERKMDRPELWAVGAFVLAGLVIPYYFSSRSLKHAEVRTGGPGWNFCKAFAILWTLFMGVAFIAAKISTSAIVSKASSSAEQTGSAFISGIGMSMIFGLWFFVLVGVIGMGAYLKKATIVEIGPTGALAIPARKSPRKSTSDQ